MIKHRGLEVFPAINGIILALAAFLCFLPFYYVFTISLSEATQVREGVISLLPQGFSLEAYQTIFRQAAFFNAFRTTVIRTVLGTAVNLALQATFGYALSRSYLKGRKIMLIMVVFTILFNPGIIPNYLIVRYTGLIDTIWALIIPNAINSFNVLVLVSFFASIPDSIEESAKMDGANDIIIFWKLMIPLSLPAIATISLFISVFHWNSLMDGIMYINKSTLKPLQVYLMDLVMRTQTEGLTGGESDTELTTITIQTAAIFAGTLPILLIYPFVQRYFMKGIMLGAIKG
ncbi:carbohydrate ABC transporter permease [Marispirochaeta aestuarii]|uniref:carbohydrate ABC transporter permease n=1 Tax=Marispirochaeta aestuarii TaxID=1963862 RepID=UPI0018EA2CB3|nr:carbohydrate ABC transporter permease [Marispirochaeta aestuarii]